MLTEPEVMQSRVQELERAVADLRAVIGNIVEHLAGGGTVRRGDALFRDLKRIHRHTRDALAKKITGGASRWWAKSLGERVVMLEAELERHRFRAVMIDKALEAGKVLPAISDEALAAELDKRALTHVSARKVDTYVDAPLALPENVGLTFEQVAEALGVPPGLVRTGAEVADATRPNAVSRAVANLAAGWEHRCDSDDRLYRLERGSTCGRCGEREAPR